MLKSKEIKKINKGITLIETLIAGSLFAVLAGVVVLSFYRYNRKLAGYGDKGWYSARS